MRHTRRWMTAVVGITALAAVACGEGLDDAGGGDDGGDGTAIEECRDTEPDVEAGSESLDDATIAVGSKDFDEQLILGNITKILLEEAGATVEDQINLGGTDAARAALTSGEIDAYWDYNGTAWISFFEQEDPIPDRVEQYEAVRNCDWVRNDLVWLAPSTFNNTYALAFRSEAADELGSPQTLSDLGSIIEEDPDQVTLCVESEFDVRNDGLPGMEEHYGYDVPGGNVSVLDTGVVYEATDRGDPCNFGEVFTTDGRIAALDLTVLEDDEQFFPLYNASPIFRGEVYEQYGAQLDELFGPVAEALDNDTMSQLNARVSAEGESPAAVAQDYLESEGLLPS